MKAFESNSGTTCEWWHLRDGEPVVIRSIGPQDLALETAFVHGLSVRSSYHRLMSTRRPDHEEIRRFTEIDPSMECALVAISKRESHDAILAAARYVLDGNRNTAKFAIVVADAVQRGGMGFKMMHCLIESAHQAGIRELSGSVFATNAGMLALARRLGFIVRQDQRNPLLNQVILPLAS